MTSWGHAPEIAALSVDWFDRPFQTIPVVRDGEFTGTADGACRVSFGSNRAGYVKPGPNSQNPDVVANEKIAADLAHLLSLPCAPVVVREPMDGWPAYTALSAVCLPQGRHWDNGPQQRPQELDERLEALRVFWTWIGDVDHGGHGQNLLYEFTGSKYHLAAIDHSFAFGHGGAEPLTAGASSGYGTANMPHTVSTREQTIAAILSLDWSLVEQVFRRLPVNLLTEADAIKKLDWVAIRKEQLRSLLGC
jgi:hypothetical protein